MEKLNRDDFGFESLPHYSTHAIEYLSDVQRLLNQAGIPSNYEAFLVELLRMAVKFVLPESGFLFADHDYLPKMFELQHMPYPVCALEFRAGPELYAQGSGLHNSLKRISLPFVPQQLPEPLARLFEKLVESPMSRLPARCIAITSVYSGEDTEWSAAVGFVVIDLDKDEPILLSESEKVIGRKIDPQRLAEDTGQRIQGLPSKHALPATFWAVPERAALVGQTMDQHLAALYVDSIDEVRTAYEFLAAVNCSNVGTQDVAAPTKLNQKRQKSGKTPFYAYKLLDLAPASERQPGAGGGGGNGTSLRTHLRRGHLRRLGEKSGNKTLWINSTMVNRGRSEALSTVYKVTGVPKL